MEINLFKALGNKLGFTVFNGINSRCCQGFHFNKPLFGNARLNGGGTTVAGANIVGIILNANKCALFF